MKDFDTWNEIKKQIQNENAHLGYKNRDIFYIKMGHNIGFEQNGKGNQFIRPVVIIKGFNKEIFLGVPLSSQQKEGKFYYQFSFEKNGVGNENIAILSQVRLFSTKRLLNKIGVIKEEDFKNLKNKLKDLID